MVSIEWKSHLAPPSKGELHGALHKKQKVVQPSGSHQTQNVSRHSPFETIIAISCAFQGLPKDCQSCWCPGRGVAFWKFLKKKTADTKVGEVQMVAWNSIRQHVFLLHFLILVAALRTSGEDALNAYGGHRHTTKTDSSLNRLLRMMTVKWPIAFLIPFTPYIYIHI